MGLVTSIIGGIQAASAATNASKVQVDAAAGVGGLTAGAFYKDAAGGLHVKL